MKFYIEPLGKKMMYTERLLLHLIGVYGHKHEYGRDAIILVSICDVTELQQIEKVRKKYPKHKIIAGGHFSKIGFKALALFVDVVWIGHVFEMLEKETYEDIVNSEHSYTKKTENEITPSHKINWDICPAIQVTEKRFYVWGGVGCKMNCSFCVTSWTEKHQVRPRINNLKNNVVRKLDKKGTVKIISNEYDNVLGSDMVQDMLLKDFLKIKKNKKRKRIRCGIEFATEESRKKNAKPIRDTELRTAIDKARDLNVELFLFFIGGYDNKGDWAKLVEAIPEDMTTFRPAVYFKWTNLEYQQKTPLWENIKEIQFENYLDKKDQQYFHGHLGMKNARVRVYPIKYPAHAIWRMCLSNVRDLEQYNMCKKAKNVKDMEKIKELFYIIEPWKTNLEQLRIV